MVSIFRRQVTTFPSRPGSISEMKYHRVLCQQNRMWQTCRQDFVVVDFYVFGCLLFGQAILVFSGVPLANVRAQKKEKKRKFKDFRDWRDMMRYGEVWRGVERYGEV